MAVQAEVRYLNDEWRDRSDVPEIGDRASRRANTSKHTVTIHDARPGLEGGEISLEANCFTLLKHISAVRDFEDDAEVRAVYYPEIKALTRRTTGAAAVFITQHVVRTEDTADFNKAYARFLHCDYSLNHPHAAARRVLERQGANPTDYEGADFAWYNAWQPFDNVALKNPLALVDAASLAARDIVEYQYTGYAPLEPEQHRRHAGSLLDTAQEPGAPLLLRLRDGPGRGVVLHPVGHPKARLGLSTHLVRQPERAVGRAATAQHRDALDGGVPEGGLAAPAVAGAPLRATVAVNIATLE